MKYAGAAPTGVVNRVAPDQTGSIRDVHEPPPDRPGRVILLNGTSSSGKTSIAEQLLLILDPPHFHMSVDVLNAMRAKAKTLAMDPAELPDVLRRTRAGFHRAVAGMARAGNDVVADYLFSESWRLLDCLTVFAGLTVFFVGVRCDPDELQRRELARADRDRGLAAAQLPNVHRHGVYDIEVDTTSASPQDCAVTIRDFLVLGEPPTAFDRLRTALRNSEK